MREGGGGGRGNNEAIIIKKDAISTVEGKQREYVRVKMLHGSKGG